MVLKDWKKKDGSYEYEWINEKEDAVCWIFDSGKNFYVTVIYHKNNMYANQVNKSFKTESQAIGFAKQYMRTH